MSKTYKCSEVHEQCKYSVMLHDPDFICDYIGIEGKRRGCKPEECDKYKPRKGKSEEIKKPLSKLNNQIVHYYENGWPLKDIAEKTGLSKAAVSSRLQRIRKTREVIRPWKRGD